jgi:hypothetical protein
MQCDIGATLPYPVFVNLWLNIEIQKQSIQSIIGATAISGQFMQILYWTLPQDRGGSV